MTKQIRAVLFDCDGVIIDSAADIADAVNATLKSHKMKTVPFEKLRTYVGNGMTALVERAVKMSHAKNAVTKNLTLSNLDKTPLPVSQEEAKKITADYLQYYFSHAAIKTTLYPGFAEMLAKLKAAGIRTGIVTNKPEKVLKQILKYFKIEKYFDAPIGSEHVKNLKPAPDGIFAALDKINEKLRKEIAAAEKKAATKPASFSHSKDDFIPIGVNETIMVGDSYTDIGAAHAAGTLAAACLNGMGDHKKMLSQKPDLILGYAAEIADAVILANKIISRDLILKK